MREEFGNRDATRLSKLLTMYVSSQFLASLLYYMQGRTKIRVVKGGGRSMKTKIEYKTRHIDRCAPMFTHDFKNVIVGWYLNSGLRFKMNFSGRA